jgi:hypothetical protein
MPTKGRNNKLIEQRNIALITRYYYWSEIWQRRHLRVLETLEKEEFFIRSATIDVIIRNDNGIYAKLVQDRPSIVDLQTWFPAFHFEDNPHSWRK